MFIIKSLLVLAALTAVAASKHTVPNKKRNFELSHSYSFEEYLKDFRLSYPASEMEERKALFETELSRVLAHNAKGASWKETVNKFSAMRKEEKRAFHGRSKGAAQHQIKENMLKGAQEELPFPLKAVSELPSNVDWRTEGVVSAVKDQGHCGSCWAFASTAVIESHVALSTGLLFDLSTEQMAMCAPNPDSCGGTGGCSGSTAELAFEYVTGSSGLFEEFQYPYTSYYGKDYECSAPAGESPVATIDGYIQLPGNNYTALMNAVATVGPIAVSVDASSWSAYDGGIYSGCNQASPDIDHAVVLVGYGEDSDGKFWLVRNSWSPAWGEAGYIRLAHTDSEDTNCGVDTTPQDGVACAGDDEPETVCGTCGIIFDSAYPLNAVAF